MKNSQTNSQINDEIDFKKEFFKYLFFWKYFLISLVFFLFLAFVYNRYSDKVFLTTAKIQILDKNDTALEMPSAVDLFSSSKINLENELEVLKSTSILERVIKNQNLTTSIEVVGNIVTNLVTEYPFSIKTKLPFDSISTISFNLELKEDGLLVKNILEEKEYFFKSYSTTKIKHDLPFEIYNINRKKWHNETYNVNFIALAEMSRFLKESIVVSKVGKQSDIISLDFKSTSPKYAQIVLNELIKVFNKDGVEDRQLIHKRTIDFVNERYTYLATELESIELDKKTFKVQNNLVDLSVNSNISLKNNSISEESLFNNQNQIFIVSNLLEELTNSNLELLPSNIGIENIEINSLINLYNELVLEKNKVISNAGPNNPYFKQLSNSISEYKSNIASSLDNYLQQLNLLKENLLIKSNRIQNNVANIPAQEKNLRAIERNQQIKEALYLFLLQKGEEAQVSYAVTEPSIKVVEYAMSGLFPIYPKTNLIYLAGILLGLLFPFIILYLIFLFDTKIHSKEDIEMFNLNLIGEIPFFDSEEKDKIFNNPNDRTIISESFRMLMSNVKYLQSQDAKSNVILVTSSIKGEGKTLNALNLSLSFSSVGKKVLLIGCDLRNPQLHKYIDYDKNVNGLVDYLINNKIDWKKNVIDPFNNHYLDILLSGPLPPNPLNLVNNGNIDILLKEAKNMYDYIIIDSAPTLLVADTKSLIDKSDILIFLTRCNITDKDVLKHISAISDNINTNVGVILNGVGQKNSYGYSYGYGYNYNYSYNYGYGYGYSSDDE